MKMKEHRVRKVPSPNPEENPTDIYFVEAEKDSWHEVAPFEVCDDAHEAIHNLLDENKKEIALTYATRAFDIGLIKNWEEVGVVK